jgi:hypothetical protein
MYECNPHGKELKKKDKDEIEIDIKDINKLVLRQIATTREIRKRNKQ